MDDPKQHQHYHSCVLLRTSSVQIGEKLPSVVFTKGDRLVSDAKVEGLLINYSFNAVKYRFKGRDIVVADAGFLLPLLTKKEKLLLERFGQILFNTLKMQQTLQFYLLSQEEILLQIQADLFTSEGVLIFGPITKHENPEGKELFLEIKESNKIEGESFRFQSQFAILSSPHFLNCFIRGNSLISSYKIDKNGKFRHCISQRLLDVLSFRYPSAHL